MSEPGHNQEHVRLAPVVRTSQQRAVAVRILAGIVAILCGVLTWLLLALKSNTAEVHRNRDLISKLACEAEELGAQPVTPATCPPSTSPTLPPTPAASNPDGLKPVIVPVPSGGTTVIYVRPSGSSSPAGGRSPSPRPSPTPTRSASRKPSPSPSPSRSCITTVGGVCVPPPGTVGR